MSSVRWIVACSCFALTLSASMPSWAETESALPGPDEGGVATAARGFDALALGTPLPLRADLQQTTATPSSGKMSGKKKAWIIVASVLGAVAIGAAVSNGGGGGGGGGY